PIWRGDSQHLLRKSLQAEVRDLETFKVFIIDLVNAIREWRHRSILMVMEGKRAGDESPVIVKLAELFKSKPYQDLCFLRNHAGHVFEAGNEKDSSKEYRRVGRIMRELIGRRWIAQRDATQWSQLQLAIMRRLSAILEAVYETIESVDVDSGDSKPV